MYFHMIYRRLNLSYDDNNFEQDSTCTVYICLKFLFNDINIENGENRHKVTLNCYSFFQIVTIELKPACILEAHVHISPGISLTTPDLQVPQIVYSLITMKLFRYDCQSRHRVSCSFSGYDARFGAQSIDCRRNVTYPSPEQCSTMCSANSNRIQINGGTRTDEKWKIRFRITQIWSDTRPACGTSPSICCLLSPFVRFTQHWANICICATYKAPQTTRPNIIFASP